MTDANSSNRAQRHIVHFDGRIERLDHEADEARILDVQIVDLSIGGASLETNQPAEVGSTWVLRLDPLLGSSFCETVVVRSCFQTAGGDYRYGVQFVSAVQLFVQAGIDLQSVISDLSQQAASQEAIAEKALANSKDATPAISFKDHATAHTLQNLRAYVSQSLTITGDLIDCDIKLEGPLSVEGAIIGGQFETNNAIQANSLGHRDYPTHVTMGTENKANAILLQVRQQLSQYEQMIAAAEEELAQLKDEGSKADHAMRERTMELEFELPELVEKRNGLQAKYDQVLTHFQAKVKIDLHVQHTIGERTTITYNQKTYRATKDIEGPVRIVCNEEQELEVIDSSQVSQPLSALMEVVSQDSPAENTPAPDAPSQDTAQQNEPDQETPAAAA